MNLPALLDPEVASDPHLVATKPVDDHIPVRALVTPKTFPVHPLVYTSMRLQKNQRPMNLTTLEHAANVTW